MGDASTEDEEIELTPHVVGDESPDEYGDLRPNLSDEIDSFWYNFAAEIEDRWDSYQSAYVRAYNFHRQDLRAVRAKLMAAATKILNDALKKTKMPAMSEWSDYARAAFRSQLKEIAGYLALETLTDMYDDVSQLMPPSKG